jgi:hypothetical protein
VFVYDRHVMIAPGDFFLEDGAVVLTYAGLEMTLRFVQAHCPRKPVLIRYAVHDGGPGSSRSLAATDRFRSDAMTSTLHVRASLITHAVGAPAVSGSRDITVEGATSACVSSERPNAT